MLSVQTNLLAWNAGREYGIQSKRVSKHTERLSSGYRVNRAADDAAGRETNILYFLQAGMGM